MATATVHFHQGQDQRFPLHSVTRLLVETQLFAKKNGLLIVLNVDKSIV